MRCAPAALILLALGLGAGRARGASAAPDPSGPSTTSEKAVVEALYPFGRRPRPEGAVLASVQDEAVARWNLGGSTDPNHASHIASLHVAPRVFVETRALSAGLPRRGSTKRLSQAGVLAQTRSHGYWPFRLCYEQVLRADPKARQRVVARFTIGRRGQVTGARPLRGESVSADLADCMARALRKLTFAPAPRRASDFELTVDLAPGDMPLPDPPAAAPRSEPSSPPPAAAEALEPARGAIQRCFEVARASDPELWGRLALAIEIDRLGRAAQVRQLDSRFPAADVVACARKAVLEAGALGPEGDPRVLVWALRLGRPPSVEPGNEQSEPKGHSTVAEAVPARVRLDP